MSATHQSDPTPAPKPSGERIFFAMAAAFLMMVMFVIAGFFVPIGAAIAMMMVALPR